MGFICMNSTCVNHYVVDMVSRLQVKETCVGYNPKESKSTLGAIC